MKKKKNKKYKNNKVLMSKIICRTQQNYLKIKIIIVVIKKINVMLKLKMKKMI